MRRPRWPVAAIAITDDPGRSSGISNSSTRRRRCKACGHRYVPIVYGYPAGDTWTDAARGRVVIGGCIPAAERYACGHCNTFNQHLQEERAKQALFAWWWEEHCREPPWWAIEAGERLHRQRYRWRRRLTRSRQALQRGQRGFADDDVERFGHYIAGVIERATDVIGSRSDLRPADLEPEEWADILRRINDGMRRHTYLDYPDAPYRESIDEAWDLFRTWFCSPRRPAEDGNTS